MDNTKEIIEFFNQNNKCNRFFAKQTQAAADNGIFPAVIIANRNNGLQRICLNLSDAREFMGVK